MEFMNSKLPPPNRPKSQILLDKKSQTQTLSESVFFQKPYNRSEEIQYVHLLLDSMFVLSTSTYIKAQKLKQLKVNMDPKLPAIRIYSWLTLFCQRIGMNQNTYVSKL